MITPAAQLGYYHGAERLRYAGSWLIAVLATTVLGTLGVVVSLLVGHGTMSHGCARLWSRALLWSSGIAVETEGSENLAANGVYVFVANHQSKLDITALLVALPMPFRRVARASLFRIPLIGWTLRRVGYAPMGVGANDSIADLLARSRQRATQSTSTVVFAEGACTAEEEIARFRKGCVYLARATGVPIVPVALINCGHLMPSGRSFADPGSIGVRIGVPMKPDPDIPASDIAMAIRASVVELKTATAP